MPRKTLLLFLAVLFASALGISRAFSEEELDKQIKTLREVFYQVKQNHIKEMDNEKLFEGAYRGMLRALEDPYTQYLNRGDTAMFSADTKGEFGGLGILIGIKEDLLTVISPFRGTPAFEAGIMAGDVILRIEGKSTERIRIDEAMRTLRGKPGTKVTITVRHPGALMDKDITITRAVITPTVVEYKVIDEQSGIGLMRISAFNETTMKGMREGISAMREQGLKALILDLRDNPGGLLTTAVRMADEFLAEGTIVSMRGRDEHGAMVYAARKGQSLESLPTIVLVNQGSASASEIVAGALKDHGRALLVGARTFGKGSVQQMFRVGEAATVKITTANYYSPSGKPIKDHVGIEPDIYVPMSVQQRIALGNQEREDRLRGQYHLDGALPKEDEALVPESEPAPGGEVTPEDVPREHEPSGPLPGLQEDESNKRWKRKTDYQLKSALNILRWQMAGNRPFARAVR